jgi:DNA-binding GntR family transcriptional regulator
MAILENIDAPPSLKAIAQQSIKEAILSKRLEPGRTYTERALARELGISKTPVREALLELKERGFIRFLPRRGIQIKAFTKKDIVDLFDLRFALESMVVRRIAAEMTPETMRRIDEIRRKELESAERRDQTQLMRVDREFHHFLSTLTRNEYVVTALENVLDLIDWMGAWTLILRERVPETLKEHGRIMETLKKKDGDGALAAMEDHMKVALKKILHNLDLAVGKGEGGKGNRRGRTAGRTLLVEG